MKKHIESILLLAIQLSSVWVSLIGDMFFLALFINASSFAVLYRHELRIQQTNAVHTEDEHVW